MPFLCHGRGSRHPHVGAAASLVGGGTFLSGPEGPPSAALSLSYEYRRPLYLFLAQLATTGKGTLPLVLIQVSPLCIPMKVLTPEEGAAALALARQALGAGVRNEPFPLPALPPVFSEKRGVFVTLTEGGKLRGCIGLPYPVMPLGEAIHEAAVSAALRDPRFPPVEPEELPEIRVEVTVLSVPEPLAGPPENRESCVRVGVHGLIVQGRGRSGLLLPQVATEYRWTACEFLDHTCVKAGLPPGTWKAPGVQVLSFEGQIFHEEEP